METMKKLLSWIQSLPVFGKILSLITIVLMMIVMIFFSSCGTTRAIVHNGTDSAVTSITITTNNPTSVQASPNVSFNDSKDR